MPIDDVVAPLDFSAWWTITGIALIVAIAAWLVFVFVHTRHRPTEAALPATPPPAAYAAGGDPFVDLRLKYLAQVDEAERAFADQEIDVRELHLRLSAIVREFAGLRRGVDTSVMTLTDIEHLTGAGRLANLIAAYYHPSFSQHSDGSGAESLDGARTVISSW